MTTDEKPPRTPRAGHAKSEIKSKDEVLQLKAELVERLRVWRRSVLKKKQDEFAQHVKLSYSLIKKYETPGMPVLPSALSLVAMAKSGLNVHWLLTGQGRMSISPELDLPAESTAALVMQLKMKEIESQLDQLEPSARMAMIESILAATENAVQVASIERDLDQQRLKHADSED